MSRLGPAVSVMPALIILRERPARKRHRLLPDGPL